MKPHKSKNDLYGLLPMLGLSLASFTSLWVGCEWDDINPPNENHVD